MATTDSTNNQSAALAFGLTQSLIKRFPELEQVWELFLAGNKTDAELAYYSTDYYKNLTSLEKNRAAQQAAQPGAYADELSRYIIEQKKRLISKGITLDENTLTTLLTEAYDAGLNEDQVDLKALSKFASPFGGDTLSSVQSLNQYGNSFGINYSQASLDKWSRDIFAGLTTVADVQAKIRQDAASAFPAYSAQIEKGISMDALASAYKSSMATILERDPDTISFQDPTLRKALQYIDSSGKASIKPLWQFEKELRSTPEWEYTNNARNTIDSLSLKVLKDWGLA